MSTELSIIDKIEDPSAFVMGMGNMFAESGMFGCKTKAQGVVLALHVAITRQSPLNLMQDYHFIEGKLSMKSEAMLRRFSQRGGKFKWNSDGRNGRAEILFEKDGSALLSVYTREDAIKAELIGGKNPNWRLREANMLRSRAVSDGLRMFDPESTGGAYTEDELADSGTIEAPAGVVEGEVVPAGTAPVVTAQSIETAKTRTRKTKEPASPATTESTSTVAPVQAAAEGVARPSESESATSDSSTRVAEATVATAPTATTTEPATVQLPQSVVDIIQLRNYVGERWPTDKVLWKDHWPKVREALGLKRPDLSDEEQLTKADELVRTKLLSWLNQQRVNVDKLSTSKDLNTWANQSPQATT